MKNFSEFILKAILLLLLSLATTDTISAKPKLISKNVMYAGSDRIATYNVDFTDDGIPDISFRFINGKYDSWSRLIFTKDGYHQAIKDKSFDIQYNADILEIKSNSTFNENSKYKVNMYDIRGNLVMRIFSDTWQGDIQKYLPVESGIYFVTISEQNGLLLTEKISIIN